MEAHNTRNVEWNGQPLDPLNECMSYTTIYCVKGIDTSVNTRDIERALKNITDENEVTVAFEIVWVDDSTFLVATRCPPKSHDLLTRHGLLLLSALKRRFPKQSICNFQEFLVQKQQLKDSQGEEGRSLSEPKMHSIPPSDTKPSAESNSSIFSRIWNRFAKKDTEQSKKRDFYKLYTIDHINRSLAENNEARNKRQRTD